jgi:hypothetical protein
MTCMCDDEIRSIHLNDIKSPEHTWRFYLLENDEYYAYENDKRLDRCTI